MKPKYEFLDHTADIKIKIYGKSMEEIFENVTLAFCEIIGRGQKIKKKKEERFEIEGGEDYEGFLRLYIDDLIWLLDSDGFIASGAKVKLQSGNLRAIIKGDQAKNYKDLDQIKAATYHDIYFKQLKDKTWEAQIVVDV